MHTLEALPNRLKSGDRIVIRGFRYIVCQTSERDEFDQPLYRLKGQYGVKGQNRYSRDDLQAEGAQLL